jgi:hypothetical protein
MQKRLIIFIEVSAMSGKNDRIILAAMVAIGIVAIAFAGAAAGIGAFVYFGEPGASPTPAATVSPAPSSTPAPTAAPAEGKNPFYIDSMKTDKGQRIYTLNIGLAADAAPVDMTKVTAQIVAGDETYPAWDYRHAEHSWSLGSNGDAILDHGEIFTMVIYAPQAGLPLKTSGSVKLVLLNDGVPVFTINGVTPV